MYNWIKKRWLIIILLILFIMLGVPVLIYLLYDTILRTYLESGITAGELLSYWGSLQAFFATVALGMLALHQNNQLKELNEHSNETNDKLMDIARKDMSVYTRLESTECEFQMLSDMYPEIFSDSEIRIAIIHISSINDNDITSAFLAKSYMSFDVWEGWHDWREDRKLDDPPELFLGSLSSSTDIIDNKRVVVRFPIMQFDKPYSGSSYKLCFRLSVTSIYGDRTIQFYNIEFENNKIKKWNTIVELAQCSIWNLSQDLYRIWLEENKTFDVSLISSEIEDLEYFFTDKTQIERLLRSAHFDRIRIVNSKKEKIEIEEILFDNYKIVDKVLGINQKGKAPLTIKLK